MTARQSAQHKYSSGTGCTASVPDIESLQSTQERGYDLFIAQVQESFGELTQQDLAGLLGVRQPTVSAAKQRGRVPLSWIIRLRQLLGNDQWPAPAPDNDHFSGLLGESARQDLSEMREHAGRPVRIYGTRCEWPKGRKSLVFPVVGYETFSRHFAPEGTLVFRVNSPAMQATLGLSSLVAVNTRDRVPESGALFAVYLQGEGVVVRRFSHAGEKMLLCADQPSLPPFELPENELRRLVVGRCIWVLREL